MIGVGSNWTRAFSLKKGVGRAVTQNLSVLALLVDFWVGHWPCAVHQFIDKEDQPRFHHFLSFQWFQGSNMAPEKFVKTAQPIVSKLPPSSS
jgi:hypothetical protein